MLKKIKILATLVWPENSCSQYHSCYHLNPGFCVAAFFGAAEFRASIFAGKSLWTSFPGPPNFLISCQQRLIHLIRKGIRRDMFAYNKGRAAITGPETPSPCCARGQGVRFPCCQALELGLVLPSSQKPPGSTCSKHRCSVHHLFEKNAWENGKMFD